MEFVLYSQVGSYESRTTSKGFTANLCATTKFVASDKELLRDVSEAHINRDSVVIGLRLKSEIHGSEVCSELMCSPRVVVEMNRVSFKSGLPDVAAPLMHVLTR